MGVKLPDLDGWVEAMAPVLRLEVPVALRPGVKANLKTAAKMAALLDKVEIKDDAEPAPTFRA